MPTLPPFRRLLLACLLFGTACGSRNDGAALPTLMSTPGDDGDAPAATQVAATQAAVQTNVAATLVHLAGTAAPEELSTANAVASQVGTVSALASQVSTVEAGTPEALASQVSTAIALATEVAPTVVAVASSLPPATRISDAEAATTITTYGEEVLGYAATILRAGGLTTEMERVLNASAGGTAQSVVADLAVQSVAALLSEGAASVSYGSGVASGDLNVDINSSSLGVFSVIRTGPLPTADAALALVLELYPKLSDRTFAPQSTPQGYAWLAEGQVSGFDPQTRAVTVIAEKVLVGVVPLGAAQYVVYAVVGKGDFATQVQP